VPPVAIEMFCACAAAAHANESNAMTRVNNFMVSSLL
jgi:hypothetical protein